MYIFAWIKPSKKKRIAPCMFDFVSDWNHLTIIALKICSLGYSVHAQPIHYFTQRWQKPAWFYLSICSLQNAQHQRSSVMCSGSFTWGVGFPLHRLNEHMPHLTAIRTEMEIHMPGPNLFMNVPTLVTKQMLRSGTQQNVRVFVHARASVQIRNSVFAHTLRDYTPLPFVLAWEYLSINMCICILVCVCLCTTNVFISQDFLLQRDGRGRWCSLFHSKQPRGCNPDMLR